ncbi:MAG TPA: HAD family hydrolase [Spirochaetia bacterium]|nr:HAD family hydrolase [Spirochaetia bacterium]
MRYKYFLFDWDGSLADTLPIWFAGYTKVFAKYGIKVTNEIIAKEVIGDWEGPGRLGITKVEEFFEELEKEVLDKLNEAKLSPGVMELLKKIKVDGGKIAIVTASRKRWVKGALRNNGLRDLVDVFLGREDVEYVKPDPESLNKALRMMGGNKEEAIMIGDNGKDVLAGKAAGMDTGLYFPKKYEEFYIKEIQQGWGARMMIENFEELERLL